MMHLQEFKSVGEMRAFYRNLRARMRALGPQPPPPPPPPAPPAAPPHEEPIQTPLLRMQRIVDAVALEFKVPQDAILSDSRIQICVTARHVVCLLAREFTYLSTIKIGRLLNRDHSTIIHAIKTIALKIANDPELRAKVERLRQCVMST
jgi:hypothetical protein